MKQAITPTELEALAKELGYQIQHDCGGYRVVREQGEGFRYLFPAQGICPTATRRDCYNFMLGAKYVHRVLSGQ